MDPVTELSLPELAEKGNVGALIRIVDNDMCTAARRNDAAHFLARFAGTEMAPKVVECLEKYRDSYHSGLDDLRETAECLMTVWSLVEDLTDNAEFLFTCLFDERVGAVGREHLLEILMRHRDGPEHEVVLRAEEVVELMETLDNPLFALCNPAEARRVQDRIDVLRYG